MSRSKGEQSSSNTKSERSVKYLVQTDSKSKGPNANLNRNLPEMDEHGLQRGVTNQKNPKNPKKYKRDQNLKDSNANLDGGSASKLESGEDSHKSIDPWMYEDPNQVSTPASETESMPGGGSTTYPSTGAGSMPGAESSTETKTTTPFGTDSSNTGGSKGHQPSPASSRGSSNSHSSSRMFKTVSTNNSFKTKNGVKILTQEVTTVYNGVKTVELYENGVLKSKTVNGVPQAVTD